jgi:Zn-dependent metalloprotease
VINHNLVHGLVAGTADLEYKGHFGALNESFTYIVSVMFEFLHLREAPQPERKTKWLTGEDIGMSCS